jgi:putative ABC transport system permease protein
MTWLVNVAHLYGVRLRARTVLVQEVFAICGIAVGVALLFASQVASTSLTGSVAQLTSGVVGNAKLQIEARDAHGFGERLFRQAQALPGVEAAVPVLEQRIGVIGRAGSENVDLIGGDPRTVRFAGPLLRHFSASALARQNALALPVSVARAIGTAPLETVQLQIGARLAPGLVATELGAREIGSLVDAPLAIAPLRYAQRLTGMQGRLARVFIQPRPGAQARVRDGLVRLAAGRLNVEPASFDSTVFAQAAGPVNQSTSTFAAICALVGFMFAYAAMLLTIHLRQGLVRELRRNGATRSQAVEALLFDALVLGVVASILGLALGELLSVTVFQANTGYLSFGFPVGTRRIVTWKSVLVAVAGGQLAASVGVLTPLRDVWIPQRRSASLEARRTPLALRGAAVVVGLACLGGTTVILRIAPQSAVVGIALLVVALICLLPPLLDGALALVDRLPEGPLMGTNRLAVVQLRERGSRPRSLAIAATGALAVFASVTIQGSHASLQRGLDRLFGEVTSASRLWVLPFGSQNLLATAAFHTSALPQLQRLPGVRSVGVYRSSFLEYGDRRIWVLAPPSDAASPVPVGQVVDGSVARATADVRSAGWAVIAQSLAKQAHLRVGESFTLPSPQPIRLKVAALSTNLGWPPGAVIVNPADYVRAWGSGDPSAYEVRLAQGYGIARVRTEIRQALRRYGGLTVETAAQRDRLQRTASRHGLERLAQIAALVLLAGVLATSTAMGGMIWQRRRRFARMKVQGYATGILWATLVFESAALLAVGCLSGAVLGMYGQLLLSHALLSVTGMPVVFSLSARVALGSFVLVTVVAAMIVAVPGRRVARVAPHP